ncbi:hypothetical protein TTHERM_00903970 (macronuclear) [Tetrahymena thermophila SB210]|uniref:Zinc carboxypeptidase family protein n=1 Tax=Tetrahymena thermophila (strain SB210) TaxID=312017 RepID=Q24GA0_TETTS|nr:hypothetical protein TTHERM_00903970 [Tetrahymena thermophila SB210]EAS06830.1 hypothetical protein TTHERM_00903970 [Tetrahymena thermophila SB210]|eukprot:XP_001027072.1 hypothetical protein TTHERM_00903970 [Tetrahymena thermophila SB210]
MNRGICCNIHKNYPIFLLNLLEKEKSKLQCVKCISNKKIEAEFLLLQDIIEFDSNSFLENWPPLSSDSLRKDIIDLKNNETDIKQHIEEFYESLTQEVIQIISQKKKEQLIQAQKVQEFKSDIIEQYQEMASIEKMKECLVQENQQTEKIEQDLNEQINSQFQKKEKYTSQLSYMMKQYQFISKLDEVRTAQFKANILEILKVVNLLPKNNFNFGTEKEEFRFENIEAYKKKIEEELQINNYEQIKIQILIDQLNLCKKELIQKMNQKNWFLDNFLKEQQTLLLNNQLNQAQFMKDIYKNTIDIQNLMTNQIKQLGQKNFKYFSEFNYNLKLKNDDAFIFSKQNNSSNYLQTNKQSKFMVERVKDENYNVQCFLNFTFDPKKKYLFKVNFSKSNQNSTFYVGLITVNNLHTKDLDEEELGFRIGSQEKKYNQNNIFGLKQQVNSQFPKQNYFGQVNLSFNNLSTPIFSQQSKQNQPIIDLTQEEIKSSLEFRVCLENNLIQYRNCNNKSQFQNVKNNNKIKNGQRYHFGVQFLSDNVGDMFEIIELEELNEFPNN